MEEDPQAEQGFLRKYVDDEEKLWYARMHISDFSVVGYPYILPLDLCDGTR